MAEDIPLPSYLTRQYDYAAGFRGLGDAWNRGKEMGLRREILQQQVNHDQLILQKAKEDAAAKLRQSIGLANYKQDVESLITKGIEPDKAARQALFRHAGDIFGGGAPLATFIDAQSKLDYQREVQTNLQDYREKMLDQKDRLGELSAAIRAAGVENTATKTLLDQQNKALEIQLKTLQTQVGAQGEDRREREFAEKTRQFEAKLNAPSVEERKLIAEQKSLIRDAKREENEAKRLLDSKGAGMLSGRKKDYEKKKAAREDLESALRDMTSESKVAPDKPSEEAQPDSPASPATKAEFDALPSGAIYINPADGKKYRKK